MPYSLSLRFCCVTVLTLLPGLGCSERYPIAPTACDDWCSLDFSKGCIPGIMPNRGADSPAECVADCENSKAPKEPECIPLFETYVDCMKRGLATDDCSLTGITHEYCNSEVIHLSVCQTCAQSDCTLCNNYCGLKNPNHCVVSSEMGTYFFDDSITRDDCVDSCQNTLMPQVYPECVPLFATYLECTERVFASADCSDNSSTADDAAVDAGIGSGPCDNEAMAFMNCMFGSGS